MARVRDPEDLTRQIEVFFKAKLNTEIGLLNTEKAANEISEDDGPIETIEDDAWYLLQLPQTWDYQQFVIWGLTNLQPEQQQEDNHVYNLEWLFEVVMVDSGEPNDSTEFYKLLRYTRALSNIVTKNVDEIQRGYKFKVQSLEPASASIAGRKFRTGGILVSTTMTAS